MRTLHLATNKRCDMVDITRLVEAAVGQSGARRGLCLISSPHTTAGIAVQEGYDPDVVRDILATLERLIPAQGDYRHAEGNSDSHLKTLFVGSSQMLPIEHGALQLGRWQAIFFCEFDGPRRREIQVQIIKDQSDDNDDKEE